MALASDLGSSTGSRCELDLAARDARDVEQVVDQARQVPHLALDDRALAFAGVDAAQAHQLQRGQDRRQRVAQLVAEHGQELVLGAVGVFGACARPDQPGDVETDGGNPIDAALAVDSG